jgi:hypothetical protein
LQLGVGVEQQVTGGAGHPGGQRQRLRGSGHVSPGGSVRCELAVDLCFHRGLDQGVAGQPDVHRAQQRRGGE